MSINNGSTQTRSESFDVRATMCRFLMACAITVSVLLPGRSLSAAEGTEFWIAFPCAREADVDGSEQTHFPDPTSGADARYGLIIETDVQPDPCDGPVTVNITFRHIPPGGIETAYPLQVCHAPQPMSADCASCVECTSDPVAAVDVPVEPGSPLDLIVPLQLSDPEDPTSARNRTFVMCDQSDVSVSTNKAIHIESSAPVSVLVYRRADQYRQFIDAYRALPVSRLGRDYYAASWSRRDPLQPYGSRIYVVGAYDGTHVTMEVPMTTGSPASRPSRVAEVLNSGDVLQVWDDQQEPGPSSSPDQDPELFRTRPPDGDWIARSPGVHIEATEPVGVLVSCEASIVAGWTDGTASLLIDQMLPTADWGREYLIPTLPNATNTCASTFRVAIQENGTTFVLVREPEDNERVQPSEGWEYDPNEDCMMMTVPDPNHPIGELRAPLKDGDIIDPYWRENNGLGWRRPVRLIANRPVGVYMAGRSTKSKLCAEERGHPFQMTVLPKTEFRHSVRFMAIPWYSMLNYPANPDDYTACALAGGLPPPKPESFDCAAFSHYLLVMRPGRADDNRVQVYLRQPGAVDPELILEDEADWQDLPNPGGGLGDYSYGIYQLHSDFAGVATTLGEYTLSARVGGEPIGVAAYVVASSGWGEAGYPAGFAPAPPPGVTDVSLVDVLPPVDIEPVPGSFSHEPLPESGRRLTWLLEDLPTLDAPLEISYDAILRNLEPYVPKLISEETVLSYFQEDRPVVRREGRVHVEVAGSAAGLAIEALDTPYVSPEQAEFLVTFTPPPGGLMPGSAGLGRASFSSASDLSNHEYVELAGVSGAEQPGALVLARDPGDGGQYAASGTATFTVDPGGLVHWVEIGYDGGIVGCRLYDGSTGLASSDVRDVALHEIPQGDYAQGGWWDDPIIDPAGDPADPLNLRSWYTMAADTVVDHAVSLEDERGSHVAVERHPELEKFFSNSFTVEAWMRGSPSEPDGIFTLLWAKGEVDENEQTLADPPTVHLYRQADKFIVQVHNPDHVPPDQTLTFDAWSGGGDAWTHIAFVVDRSTPASSARVYVDGVMLSPASGGNGLIPMPLLRGPMRLGADDAQDDPLTAGLDDCSCGRLDEVRLYATADVSIDASRAAGLAHEYAPAESGLIGQWSFDPSPRDVSGNALGGRFVNAARITGRSSDAAFPRRAYIVTTSHGLDIIDAIENKLWMRFLTDRWFLLCAQGAPSPQSLDQVVVSDGRLYAVARAIVPDSPLWGSQAPVCVLDLQSDRVLNLDDHVVIVTDTISPLKLSQHNHRSSIASESLSPNVWLGLSQSQVRCLSVHRVSEAEDIVALGTQDQVLLLGLSLQDPDNSTVSSRSGMEPVKHARLVPSPNGTLDLYVVHEPPGAGVRLARWSSIDYTPSIDLASFPWTAPAAEFGPQYKFGEYFYGGAARSIGDMEIVTGGSPTSSSAADHSIFLATAEGVLRINENRGTPAGEDAVMILADVSGVPQTEPVPSTLDLLAGDSNIVAGVRLQRGAAEDGSDLLWVGTTSVAGRSGAVTMIDADADGAMAQVGSASQESLPGEFILGVVERAIVTERGFVDCMLLGSSPESSGIEVRVRTGPSRDAFSALDAIAPGTGLGDLIPFTMEGAPADGARLARYVSRVPPSVPMSRCLQVEATLLTDDPRVTPVLDALFVTYTSATLAIDVTVEGDQDIAETREATVARVARIPLEKSDLLPMGVPAVPVQWTRRFSTAEVLPGGYRARATLVNTETETEVLTASDPFDVVAPPLGEIISNSVRTDRPSYVAHDMVEVTSVVGNETLNVPLDDVVVRLWLTRGATEYPEYLATSYRIDRLEPNAQPHVHREVFRVQPDLPPLTGYVVRQEILLNGTPVATAQAPFNVLPQPEIVGTLEVTPSVVDGSKDLTLELVSTATNVGSQALTNVTLHVTITGPDGEPPRNRAGDPLPSVTFSATAGTMARGERFDRFVIPYEAAFKDGPYVAELTATAAQLPSEVHLDYGAFVVLNGDQGGSPPAYLAIDLGALPGDSDSAALSINADGDIVGYSGTGSGKQAVLWRCGEIYPIPGATGPSEAVSISDDGYVVGSLTNTGNERGFVWYSDPESPAIPSANATELGTLGGAYSAARAVSNGGGLNTVVGQAATLSSQFGFKTTIDSLTPVQLPSPATGTTVGDAMSVNDYGDIVGSYVRFGQTKSFIFSNGVMQDLGLPVPYTSVVLRDVSNERQAVGTATISGGQKVAVAAHGRLVRALDVPPGTDAVARAVNDRGRVVGQVGTHAALWIGDSHRDVNDTSTLLNGGCWDEITIASDISNDGRIVGTGIPVAPGGSAAPHAVLLEPFPFDTSLVSSLAMWVRADILVDTDASGTVTRWKDVLCSTDMDFVAPEGATPQRLSGACCDPAITLDGDALEQNVGFGTPESSFTLFIVADVPEGANGTLVSTGTGVEAAEIAFQSELVQLQRPGGDLLFGRPAYRGRGVYTVVVGVGAGQNDSPKVELFADGVLVESAVEDVTVQQLRIGTNADGSEHLTCAVRELLLFTSTLDPTERKEIEDYLGIKHDIRSNDAIGGPLLWLRADRGLGLASGVVEEWHNQADPRGVLSQAHPSFRPAIESEGPACRPSIVFNGAASEHLLANGIARHVDAVLTIDTSGSMDEDDNNGKWGDDDDDHEGTRLETAKAAGLEFVNRLLEDAGNRVGLVWFSSFQPGADCTTSVLGDGGEAPCSDNYGRMPLTTDATIPCDTAQGYSIHYALTENEAGLHGCSNSHTNYTEALKALASTFELESPNRKVAVFMSDGKPYPVGSNNDEEDIYPEVRKLRDEGVVLHTVGIDLDSGARNRLMTMAELGGGRYHEVDSSGTDLVDALLAIEGDVGVVLEQGTMSLTFACPAAAPLADEPILVIGRTQATASEPATGLSVWRTTDQQLKIVLWGEGAAGVWFETLAAPITCNGELNHLQVDFGGPDGEEVLRAFLNDMPVSAPIALGAGQRAAIDSSNIVVGGAPDGALNPSGVETTGFFTGSVAELLLYSYVLTAEGRTDVSNYVNAKYDLVPPANLPPVARAGPDQSVEDFGWDGAESVTLDASGSIDPDGHASELVYRWFEGLQEIATGPQPTIPLSLGTHFLEVHVTDLGGLTGIDTVVVSVTPISDGRIVHYRLDRWHGDDSKKAFDSSGNDFPLEIFSDSFQYLPGRHDYSLVFDGRTVIDADGLVEGGFLPEGNAPRTVSFWFEAHEEGVNPDAAVLDYGDGGIGKRFRVIANADRIAIDFGGEIRGREGLALSPEWHHVAIVVPSGAVWSDQVRLYVDGQVIPPTTLQGVGPVPIQTGNKFGTIGMSKEEVFHIGRVDDVRVFAGEMSVEALYREPPLAQWMMDEGGGDWVADTTRIDPMNDRLARIEGARWDSDVYPRHSFLLFESGTEAVTEVENPLLVPDAGFTVAAWVKMMAAGPLLWQEGSSGNVTWIGVSADGPYTRLSGNILQAEREIDAQWHFVVLVADKSGVSLYLDGKEAGSFDTSGLLDVRGKLHFGGSDDVGAFKGGIDDVRIYKRILEKAEVAELFVRLRQ